jgi:hypothetical protein
MDNWIDGFSPSIQFFILTLAEAGGGACAEFADFANHAEFAQRSTNPRGLA